MRTSQRWFGFAAIVASLVSLPVVGTAQARAVTGTYKVTLDIPGGGGSMSAVIVVKKEAGAFGGSLAADGYPTIPVSNVVPSDTGVTLQGDSPDGNVAISMKFVGADKVMGKLVYQGNELPLNGTFAADGAAAPAGALASAAGTYELKSTEPLMGSSEFPVTCSVTKSAAGTYAGTCGNDQGGAAIAELKVDGNVVTMTGDSPAGPFKLAITIAGRDAAGTLSLGGESAKMKGTFAPK